MKVALDNLMSNATVDSTEYIPISDLEAPPIITICPRQREDQQKLKQSSWGYFESIENLLQGILNPNYTGTQAKYVLPGKEKINLPFLFLS